MGSFLCASYPLPVCFLPASCALPTCFLWFSYLTPVDFFLASCVPTCSLWVSYLLLGHPLLGCEVMNSLDTDPGLHIFFTMVKYM